LSLLLKALKQAETAQADKADADRLRDRELELEPLAAAGSQQEWVEPPNLLFGASGAAAEPPPRKGLRVPRLSLVPLTALIATLIAIGYGIYLYLALQPVTPPAPVARPANALPPPVATLPAAAPVAPATTAAAETEKPDPAPRVAAPATAGAARSATRAAAPPRSAAAPRPAPAPAPSFQPDAQSALLADAYAAYQRGALADAQRLYAEAAARGRSIDALLGLAAIASLQQRDADAERHYREVLELDPRNAAAQGALFDLLGNTDSQATESRLKTLIERDPSPPLQQTLGNLYAEQGRWREAQAAYYEAWRGAPGNGDYAYNLAVSLDQLRQYGAALGFYEKALAAGGVHRFDRARAEARVQQLQALR
jgi:tetratricopeptide (TPR) repeat protein